MLKNVLTALALVLVAAAGLLPFSGAPRAADASAVETTSTAPAAKPVPSIAERVAD